MYIYAQTEGKRLTAYVDPMSRCRVIVELLSGDRQPAAALAAATDKHREGVRIHDDTAGLELIDCMTEEERNREASSVSGNDTVDPQLP